ncbi:MAG TPA: PAS domain S-box protein [Syntrophales bacterium]|nr:PAS domain S-box protein [Syntrophales bacterium]
MDITEQRRIREALRESEQRLADIIEFLPDATFAIDREGIVIACNRAMEEMTGIKDRISSAGATMNTP